MTTKPPPLLDCPSPFKTLNAELREARLQSTRRAVADAIRRRVDLDDRLFDRFLPFDLRVASCQHWTPICVAVRAAEWFEALGVRTVVDIGSGAGKFCVAAALAGGSTFLGLEQRPRLIAAARSIARYFDVEDRVQFVEATFGPTPAPVADAYYFYNSFGENLLEDGENLLLKDVELGKQRYARDVAAAVELMRRAAMGTLVVTYNGFGGRIPMSYEEIHVDRETPNVLRAWRKTRAEHPPPP